MKRDRGSEKGPVNTHTHTAHTHTHPKRSELPPATWRPRIFFKNFFRPPGGRGKMINRICMSVCMVYGLNSPKKIKIKKIKEEERRLEGRRQKRPGRRETHLLHQKNVREQSRHQERQRTVKTPRTSENSQDIRERQRTVKTSENIREQTVKTSENIREQSRTTENSQDIRELIVRASK